MWWAIAGAIVLVVIILVLAFALAKTNKKLGKKERENEELENQNSLLREGLKARRAADSTLDDLLFDTHPDPSP